MVGLDEGGGELGVARPIVHGETADIDIGFGESRWLFGDEMDAIGGADQMVSGCGVEQGRARKHAKKKGVESGHRRSVGLGAGSKELASKIAEMNLGGQGEFWRQPSRGLNYW